MFRIFLRSDKSHANYAKVNIFCLSSHICCQSTFYIPTKLFHPDILQIPAEYHFISLTDFQIFQSGPELAGKNFS